MTGLQVHYDEGALGTRVGQIGVPPIGREPDIVQVAALRRNRFVEADHLRDPVRPQVDPDELGTTRHHGPRRRRGRVDDPEIAAPIGDDALDADEVIAGRELVLPDVAPAVPLGVGIGPDPAVARQLGDGDGRVFGPAREVHENAPVRGDRDAGHLVLEGSHELQSGLAARRWRRPLLSGGCAGEERQRERGAGGVETGHGSLICIIGLGASGGGYCTNTARTQPSSLCLNMW